MAVGALPDGIPVIVGLSGDFTENAAVIVTGTKVEQLTYPEGGVSCLAVGELPDGTLVLVGGGGHSFTGSVQVWRLADGTPVSKPLTSHGGEVRAAAVRRPLIVSGSGDGTVRVWRLTDSTLIGEPLRGHVGGVSAVAVGSLQDVAPSSSAGMAMGRCGYGG